jgi:poly-gamma-glutamate capsule biosynthesis protein CapA/YwtB (metallophosphatase superfamily)
VNARRKEEATLLAVGDIAPDRADPNECFALIRDAIGAANLGFCQLETCLTDTGMRLPQARHAVRGRPAIAAALKHANFDVVSFASNHCMDWGADALLETIAHLDAQGLSVVGAGANIQAARRPVIREIGGTHVAFLAYCSILPAAYWAEHHRAGCAPMRAWTHYEQIESDQPGTPSRIHTYAHREDLALMRDDIRTAREQADVVVVSMHWGIHFVPAVIADYQREVGHAAIDAGADLVLGSHPHILKGFEVYRGRPIFYSLGNFAVDLRIDKAHAESKSFREIQALNPEWQVDLTGLYNFPEDSRKTMIVKVGFAGGKIMGVSLLPAFINRQAQPRLLRHEDPLFGEVSDYLAGINRQADLNGAFELDGDELRVTGTDSTQSESSG